MFKVSTTLRRFFDCRAHTRTRARGFTLVELLVVVGIIALLISILLPSLTKARNAANTVNCLANLRQMGSGFQLYANAYNGAFPATFQTRISNYATGANNSTSYGFYHYLGLMLGYAKDIDKVSTFFSPTSTTDNLNHIFFDRAQDSYLRAHAFRHFLDYCMNQVTMDTKRPVPDSVWPAVKYNTTFKVAQFKYPGEVMLVLDATGQQAYINTGKISQIDARHNRKAKGGYVNVLYMDGHADSVYSAGVTATFLPAVIGPNFWSTPPIP